ncbi:hypothetical protein [Micromonospora sp. NPDC093244]|uniref:hypothetical protein n=1 Tax=Micromonospora sp. NPDC093244 TaxID=3155071 RepID=UPI00344765C5
MTAAILFLTRFSHVPTEQVKCGTEAWVPGRPGVDVHPLLCFNRRDSEAPKLLRRLKQSKGLKATGRRLVAPPEFADVELVLDATPAGDPAGAGARDRVRPGGGPPARRA